MELDVLLLSRIQFALTICFHFIFPPITIGLAWLLVILERQSWKKGEEAYTKIAVFFSKVLAITFAVGVATGIVMEFQFGMNWAKYSEFVGDIFGAPLAAEGILSFFLESAFMGLYLFGRNKVSKAVHWFSILMVAVGSTLSGFWILVANSWQQTPAGYVIKNGRAELTDFWAAVFNPSTIPRFFHTIDAALVTGAFFMAGISAYLILKKREVEAGKKSLKLSLIFGMVASIMIFFPTVHHHALQVARTQPNKLAAIEGHFETQKKAPFILFGIPDGNQLKYAIEVPVPGLLSWLVTGDWNGEVKGLNDIPENIRPPVILPFFSFHTMVALGLLFISVSILGVIFLALKSLWEKKWFLKLLIIFTPLPVIACQLGWIAAEVGRQPWIVYGELKVQDAFSASVSAGEVLFSIILFSLIYIFLGSIWIYTLMEKLKKGP